jgi:hypothetical protein
MSGVDEEERKRQELKDFCLISLALALLMVPLSLSGQVEHVGGAIYVGAHIEFVARYSAEDNKHDKKDTLLEKIEGPYRPGYETLNMEAAVIYLSGKVGDRVTWVMGEAFTMQTYDLGPIEPDLEQGFAGRVGNEKVIPAGAATLLDARITWNISEGMALNMGRYIPRTSMSVSPHRLALHHLVDPPMFIKTGGYAFHLVPLPRFQTGVGISVGLGPATISWDFFNGNALTDPDSLSDMDRFKGGVIKMAVTSRGFHAGVYYLNERSAVEEGSITIARISAIPEDIMELDDKDRVEDFMDIILIDKINLDDDNNLTQWGLELAYTSRRIIMAFEYLDTVLELMDTDVPDLKQQSYYFLAGGKVGPVQLVFRYEFAEAGYDEYLDDLEGRKASEDDISDQQVNYVLGLNYKLNDNTTIALNYTLKQPEVPDDIKLYEGDIGTGWNIDGKDKWNEIAIDWDYPDISEFSVMVELALP